MQHQHHSHTDNVIAKEAKELSKEYGRFRKFADENSLLMGVLVLGVAALVGINTLFWVSWTAPNTPRSMGVSQEILTTTIKKSLQSADNAALSVKVKDVTANSNSDPMFSLGDDETMLIMHVSVTNTTKSAQQLTPVRQFYIRSSEGDYATIRPSSSITDPLSFQQVPAGATVAGQIGFAIPKRLSNPLLYIDTAWDMTTPLVIDVLH